MSNANKLRDHALIALTVHRLVDVVDREGHPEAAVFLRSLVTDLSIHELGAIDFVDGISIAVTLIFPGAETKKPGAQGAPGAEA